MHPLVIIQEITVFHAGMSGAYKVFLFPYSARRRRKMVWWVIAGRTLTAGSILRTITVFWDITPCSSLKVNRRFGGTNRLRVQGRRIIRARNQRKSRWQAEQDGGDVFLRNVSRLSTDYTTLYPTRWYSSWSPLWDPQILRSWGVVRRVNPL
jgi:hypothetical protein